MQQSVRFVSIWEGRDESDETEADMMDHTQPPKVTVDEMNAFIGGHFGGASNACEHMAFGEAVAVMHPSPEMLRPGKIISGPTVFSICDAALFYAALSCTSMEPMTLTSEMSIRFLRPARGEVIRARATIHTLAGRNVVGTVEAWTDDPAKPVAVAQGTYVRPKQA
ncbi:MAG: PaaI family thioesterase [Acidimicrobiia bacterium]|nr:PaaI family thioesterase [Acidimicrobiia bacterium]